MIKAESYLLQIVQAVFTKTNISYILDKEETLSVISQNTASQLKKLLAHGLTFELMHRGGWQQTISLSDKKYYKEKNSLWQRYQPIQWHFSTVSFELLQWLTQENMAKPKNKFTKAPKSLADEFLYYLIAEFLIRHGFSLNTAGFSHSYLCWLAYPNHLITHYSIPKNLHFNNLVKNEAAIVLEGLQQDLKKFWYNQEQAKLKLKQTQELIKKSKIQYQVLSLFYQAIKENKRFDLANFIIELAATFLKIIPTPLIWIQNLKLQDTLQARQQAIQEASALFKIVVQLGQELENARSVSYFDEEYEYSQALLKCWQVLGSQGLAQAQAFIKTGQNYDIFS